MTVESVNDLYVWLFAAAIAAGAWMLVRFKSASLLERMLVAAVPAAAVTMGLYVYSAALHPPNWVWDGARLGPAVAVRFGVKGYLMPGGGPAVGFFLGPLSAVAYFPA